MDVMFRFRWFRFLNLDPYFLSTEDVAWVCDCTDLKFCLIYVRNIYFFNSTFFWKGFWAQLCVCVYIYILAWERNKIQTSLVEEKHSPPPSPSGSLFFYFLVWKFVGCEKRSPSSLYYYYYYSKNSIGIMTKLMDDWKNDLISIVGENFFLRFFVTYFSLRIFYQLFENNWRLYFYINRGKAIKEDNNSNN